MNESPNNSTTPIPGSDGPGVDASSPVNGSQRKRQPPPPEVRGPAIMTAVLMAIFCVIVLVVSVEPPWLQIVWDRIRFLTAALLPGFLVAATFLAAGDILIRKTVPFLTRSERAVMAFGSGLGLACVYVSILGLDINNRLFFPWLLVLPFIAWNAVYLRSRTAGSGIRWQNLIANPRALGKASIPVIIAVTLLFGFALTPPVLFDVTEYHLGAWTSYFDLQARSFRYVPMPYNFYARFPFPVEALYHFSLLTGAKLIDTGPKLINAICVLACAGLAASFVGRCGGSRKAQLLAAFVALTLPVMQAVSLDAMIDAPVALLVMGSLYAALLAGGVLPRKLTADIDPASNNALADDSPAPSRQLIYASAVMFGAALASKYTVAQIYLLPWCLVALPCLWRASAGHRLQWLGKAALLGALPMAVWYGKNVAFYGNPLEPFFVKWFRPYDAAGIAREKFYIDSHFPQSPLTAAYWTSLLPRLPVFGWIYIVACMGWLYRRDRAVIARVALFCVVAFLLWNTVRESQDRFLLPSMLLISSCAVVGAASLPRRSYRRIAAITIIVFCSINLFQQALKFRNSGAVGYLLSFKPTFHPNAADEPPTPREEFMEKNLGDLGRIITRIRQTIPTTSTILLVYEARPYLFSNKTAYNTVWDDSILLDTIRRSASADEARAALAAAGYTHVLINRQELLRYIQQYARPAQLLPLGVRTGDDPRAAWVNTDHPEDLFPPFYRDPDWQRLRPIVHELLNQFDQQATLREGFPANAAGGKSIDITVSPIIP